jgi:predicted O-methyltransferase YrrM
MKALHPNTNQLKFTTSPVLSFLNLIVNFDRENIVVAEVGTFVGATSIYAVQLVKQKHGKYIAIDHFFGSDMPDKGKHTPHSIHTFQGNSFLNVFKENIKSVECDDITTIYNMTSLEAANEIENESLDICFIDACHKYSSVKNDILAYLPKVKKGGILCGHDFEKGSHVLVDQIQPEELESDYIHKFVKSFIVSELVVNNQVFERKLIDQKDSAFWFHPGVTKAVYELFFNSPVLEITNDHVWIVKI